MYGQCKRTHLWLPIFCVVTACSFCQPPGQARGDEPGSAGVAAERRASHPLDPALEMARSSLQHSRDNIRDYTAVLAKRVRIDGELGQREHMFVKIRNRKVAHGRLMTPLSVYAKFLQPKSTQGREFIWVEGRNAGKLIVQQNLFRLHLDPTGRLAMRGQRYPVSDIGLENLLIKLIETGERDRGYGECDVQFFQNVKLGERACTLIEVIHPVRRSYFDFYCARVYFDNELNLPIRYESWSWPLEADSRPLLEEEFTFTGVTVNVGLTDRDFDLDKVAHNDPHRTEQRRDATGPDAPGAG